jgi:predicted permease
MRVWHIVRTWLQSVVYRDSRESDLREELQFHLERETERLQAAGVPLDAARLQARQVFGGVEQVKDECRDARGTAIVDDLVRDTLYAFRSFRRAPLAAVTIVATLGLGLGLVAAVFALLNAFFFRVDEVRSPHELFAVVYPRTANKEPERLTRVQVDALVRETGAFSDAFAAGPDTDGWIAGRRMEGSLVTGNFFQVLGVSAARGRTFTTVDDRVGGRPVLVLSHHAWSRDFGGEPEVLTHDILVNGSPFRVVGVMPEGFRGLTVTPPDFWAPLSFLGQLNRTLQGGEDSVGVSVVGRLRPGVSRGRAQAEILGWDSRRRAADGRDDRSPAGLTLEPRRGTLAMSAEALAVFAPLFFAFGLILLIGCANVANLLLARAVARQREIGVRLAIGASRRRVIRQLLTESLVLALASAALAWGISRSALGAFVYAVTSTWPPELGDQRFTVPPADWHVALFLVLGAAASTLFFALAPALQATRVELVRAIRGEVVRDARPGRARTALVAIQVTASVILLVTAAVFLRGTLAAAAFDPGLRTADVLTVDVANEPRRGQLLDTLRREAAVASMAASWPTGEGGLAGRRAFADGVAGKSPVRYQFVSPEYFGVVGIDMVRGRGFTAAEHDSSAAVAVVSESVARQLWPSLDPVGQVLRLEPDPGPRERHPAVRVTEEQDLPLLSRTAVVVGVARDVAGFRILGTKVGAAGVYLPIDLATARTALSVRVHGDPGRARRALEERIAMIDPDLAHVSSLGTLANMDAYLLGLAFWLTLVLGALALLLTLSGLFGVLSYLVEQRTREIGVRMALGATRRSIGALVVSQSAGPVGLGLLAGSILTIALASVILSTPAAEMVSATVRLFDPIAYAASLLCIVAACTCAALIPALRAGGIDPTAALRRD